MVFACPGFIFLFGFVGPGCCLRAFSSNADRRFWDGSFWICCIVYVALTHWMCSEWQENEKWKCLVRTQTLNTKEKLQTHTCRAKRYFAVMTRMISMKEAHFVRSEKSIHKKIKCIGIIHENSLKDGEYPKRSTLHKNCVGCRGRVFNIPEFNARKPLFTSIFSERKETQWLTEYT